jgi:ribosomal silencing factor RsfS
MREELGRKTRARTASRAEGDTDWAMIHVGEGVCVNLFTEEGRERWNLEELWA